MLRKSALFLIGFITICTLVCVAGYWYFILRPLPMTNGVQYLFGLRDDVKVVRDRWGVPHIYAKNEADLFFGQGFVHAQDRLWQMEYQRRLAAGRLAEIFGPKALEVDRLTRTLGLARAAEDEWYMLPDEDLALLDAYCDGVNAFIEKQMGKLPLEFRLLGFTPELWRPVDSLAWAKVMALFGGMNWQEEIVRAMLVHRLGESAAGDLLQRVGGKIPTIVPKDTAFEKSRVNDALTPWLAFGGASNSWVVSGDRTVSGKPILANDMHLSLSIPSIWYEIHLVGDGYDVTGLSLPGTPLVVAGHNRDIAWGVTFAYVDTQDIFVEKMNPRKRGQYLYRDEWLDAEHIVETIEVKGQTSVDQDVWVTRHGPIINQTANGVRPLHMTMALKWSAHDPGALIGPLKRLNRARNWSDFKTAAFDWTEPAMNLVYADREGHIGYVLAARVPVRRDERAPGPYPGWTDEFEWLGYLPDTDKPFLFDPPEGFIVTANNRIVPDTFPHYLAQDYDPGFRAERILQVLGMNEQITLEDCRNLQGDVLGLDAERLVNALASVSINNPEAKRLLSILKAWDGRFDRDSIGGAVYAVLLSRLMENTFRDDLGLTADFFLGEGLTALKPLTLFVQMSPAILTDLLSEPESAWFGGPTEGSVDGFTYVVEKSLLETADFLKKKMGKNPKSWSWGRIHQVKLEHPLGRSWLLDRLLNLGPYQGSGHLTTVLQSTVAPGMDFGLNGWTASNRHIFDVADWNRSRGMIVPGQSGQVGSAHYWNQMNLWLDIRHHSLPYDWESVGGVTDAVLELKQDEK